MRRLKAGKLSLKSLLPHSSRPTKDAFLQKCSQFNVVIYDKSTKVFENADACSMIALLYKRIKKEGCKVSILRDGSPSLIKNELQHTTINSSIRDNLRLFSDTKLFQKAFFKEIKKAMAISNKISEI